MYYTLECDYEDWEEEQQKNTKTPIKKSFDLGLFEQIKNQIKSDSKKDIKKEEKIEIKKERREDTKEDKRDEKKDDRKEDRKDDEIVTTTPKNLRRSQSSSRELRNLLSDVRQTKPWSNSAAKGDHRITPLHFSIFNQNINPFYQKKE